MSRVLLISANTSDEPMAVYPLGMAHVAASLVRAGHQVRQTDNLFASGNGWLAGEIEGFSPEVVGVSVRNIDNVDFLSVAESWSLGRLKALVAELKGLTRAPVVLGGPGFSLMPEAILNFTGADHGVCGEGETVFPELVAGLGRGELFPALITPGERLPAPELVRPLRDPGLGAEYVAASGVLNVQSKRGCPHGCAYCSYPLIEGRAFRHRDPRETAQEVAELARELAPSLIYFTDSVMNDPRDRYLELAEELARLGAPAPWTGLFRPEKIRDADLILLKRSGLAAMEVGTDAATDETMAGLNKGFGFEQALEFHRACVRARVPCAHFVIFGGPGETRETVQKGLANLERLQSAVVFAYMGIRILPGTAVRDLAVREGMIDADDPLLTPAFYFSPEIEPGELESALVRGFRGRRGRFFPPGAAAERTRVARRFGGTGVLWDSLISFPKGAGEGS